MFVSYGQVRYRVIAEPVLVVLAAQLVVAALPRVRALGSRVSPG
jgi:hypothetical protein